MYANIQRRKLRVKVTGIITSHPMIVWNQPKSKGLEVT